MKSINGWWIKSLIKFTCRTILFSPYTDLHDWMHGFNGMKFKCNLIIGN